MTIIERGKVTEAWVSDVEKQILDGTRNFNVVVVPENDAFPTVTELTDWWLIQDDADRVLYVGTEETFSDYQRERGERDRWEN